STMQELRDFELDQAGTPVSWRARPGQRIVARDGNIWLTVEGQHSDVWLAPGQSFALPEGAWVWISADAPRARFTLAQEAAPLAGGGQVALPRPGPRPGPMRVRGAAAGGGRARHLWREGQSCEAHAGRVMAAALSAPASRSTAWRRLPATTAPAAAARC